MALGKRGIDQMGLNTTVGIIVPLQPTVDKDRMPSGVQPNVDASMNSFGIPVFYGNINPEIAKSYYIHPTSQGQRAAVASRQSMMFDARNSPSRSQKNEGYTLPIQQYGAQITWATPSGQNTAGKRQSQPSIKQASPFSTAVPIPTRMPWDL